MDPRTDLRWLLVQMLFSLAIAEVGKQFAKLFSQGRRFADVLPAITHLVLTTAVITTSWIGWSLAVARDLDPKDHLSVGTPAHPAQGLFSWPFLVPAIDVAVVACYFIMAHGAEIPDSKNEPMIHSARSEARLLVIIFGGYVLWDIVSHGAMHGFAQFWSFGWSTILCFVFAGIAWWFLSSMRGFASVVLADFSLMALVFLFRAIKAQNGIAMSILAALFPLFLICALVSEQQAKREAPSVSGDLPPDGPSGCSPSATTELVPPDELRKQKGDSHVVESIPPVGEPKEA